jgi:copper(I)-binding protein
MMSLIRNFISSNIFVIIIIFSTYLSSGTVLFAHEYEVGKIKIEHPWLRAPKDGDNTAQFFAVLENKGDTPDKLIAIKSEKFGKAVIIADGKNESPLIIAPKQKLTLTPGAGYASLTDIKKYLEIGWGLEMVLVFEKAGEVTIDAAIDAPDAKHAHDAEAMARWEKAHGKDVSSSNKEPHKDHHGHEHNMMHHHGDMKM